MASSHAIVGVSARLPGAPDLASFWSMCRKGIDGLTELTDEQLRSAGVSAAELADPYYVRRAGVLRDPEAFDADYFGIRRREALYMDPQIRMLLEESVNALTDAGIDPARETGTIAVLAGMASTISSYGLAHAADYVPYLLQTGSIAANGIGHDFLSTHVSDALGLRGPSFTVQSACSTALTAIHMACRLLEAGDCDIALVGGCTVRWPQFRGHVYKDGGIFSRTGVLRAFDEQRDGTVFTSAAGCVVIKRLEDAVSEGDRIRAIIRGTALNNDGGGKGSFAAPGKTGLVQCMRRALENADRHPHDIDLIEAHATATAAGDVNEFNAMLEVFGHHGADERPRWLGCSKSHVGHTGSAAGLVSALHGVLAMEHRHIPPTANLTRPDPSLDWQALPFRLADRGHDWGHDGRALTTMVNALGVGGTNVSMILESAPAPAQPEPMPSGVTLLTMSAASEPALRQSARDLADWLSIHPEHRLDEVAASLNHGRPRRAHRLALLARTTGHDEAIETLRDYGLGGLGNPPHERLRVGTIDRYEAPNASPPAPPAGLEQLAADFVAGADVDLEPATPRRAGRRLDLPAYPFAKTRFSFDTHTCGQLGSHRATETTPLMVTHPLLGRGNDQQGVLTFETTISTADPAWVSDHRLFGHVVMPGAAYVEIALAAARVWSAEGPWVIEQLTFERPIMLDETPLQLTTLVMPQADGSARLEIRTRREAAVRATRHVTGELRSAAPSTEQPDLARQRSLCPEAVNVEQIYAFAAQTGLDYGPAFRGLHAVWQGASHILARLQLGPDDAPPTWPGLVYPPLLDSAFQSRKAVGLRQAANGPTRVPFRVGRIEQHQALSGSGWASVAPAASGDDALQDIALFDDDGAIALVLRDFESRPIAADRLRRDPQDQADPLATQFTVEWEALANLTEPTTAKPRNILICGRSVDVLGQSLRARGHSVTVAEEPGDGAFAAWQASPSTESRWLIHVAAVSSLDELDQAHAAIELSAELLACVQAVTVELDGMTMVASGGALAVDAHEAPDPRLASLAGVARTVLAERASWRPRFVDLPGAELPDDLGPLLEGESGLYAWRSGHWLTPSIRPWLPDDKLNLRLPPGDLRLALAKRGSLHDLQASPLELPVELAPDRVRVRVRATGLNFRDVLNVLDMYPGDPGPPGGEYCGEVEAVGDAVHRVAVGQRVMGFHRGTFATRIDVDPALLVAVPDSLSDVEAASIPVVGCTAQLALDQMGLEPGQRILIHAAAGGLGMAAVALAQSAGLEVIATASAPKRALLRGLGVQQVFDSRHTSYAEDIDKPVHAVLNSLTGPGFIEATLGCLAPEGCFVEVAKRNIWTAAQMHAARPDVRYHVLALDDLRVNDPQAVAGVLERVAQAVGSGRVRAPLVRAIPLAQTRLAMKRMQQGTHVGKLALRFPPRPLVPAGGTLLITGGLGALGLAMARELAARGAMCLVLAARRPPSPEAEVVLTDLERRGCKAVAVCADVSTVSGVDTLLETIANDPELPPLRGIIHAAGVLDDGALDNMTKQRLERVMAPKVVGAWRLHEQTRALPLDLFVLVSSASAVWAAPGRASYAAANAFLDGLAALRQSLGLPGLAMQFSAIAGGGMASSIADAQRRWSALGVRPLAPEVALRAMFDALQQGRHGLVVADHEWSRFARARPATASMLAHLHACRPMGPSDADDALAWIREILKDALLLDDLPPADASLEQLGVDSLSVVEILDRMAPRIGRDILSAAELPRFDTVATLARHLEPHLASREPPPQDPPRQARGASHGAPASAPSVLAGVKAAVQDVVMLDDPPSESTTLDALDLDSLMQVDLLEQLEQRFGRGVVSREQLRGPLTLSTLAQAIEHRIEQTRGDVIEARDAADDVVQTASDDGMSSGIDARAFPTPTISTTSMRTLHPSQYLYWYAERLGYDEVVCLRVALRGEVDRDRLQAVVQAVCFANPQLLQAIDPSKPRYLPLLGSPPVIEVLAAIEEPAQRQDRFLAWSHARYDLAKPPYIRLGLMRLGAGVELWASAAHILFDRQGFAFFLAAIDEGYTTGRLLSFAAPAPSPGPAASQHLAFWDEYLADCPRPRLPPSMVRRDWNRPQRPVEFTIESSLIHTLQSRFRGAEWTRALEAATVAAFRSICGVGPLVLGRIRHGRDLPAHENALDSQVAFDLLVLRSETTDPNALLDELEQQTRRIAPHRHVGMLEKVARWPAVVGPKPLTRVGARALGWVLRDDSTDAAAAGLRADARASLFGAAITGLRSPSDANLTINISFEHFMGVIRRVTSSDEGLFVRSLGDERIFMPKKHYTPVVMRMKPDGDLGGFALSKLRPEVSMALGERLQDELQRLLSARATKDSA